MNKKIESILFGKTKNPIGRIAICIVYILALYLATVKFFTPIFFTNNYKYDNFTFFCDDYEKLGSDFTQEDFQKECIRLAQKIENHPLYKKNLKASFFFCNSNSQFNFIAGFPTGINSIGVCNYFLVKNIVLNKTNLKEGIVTGGLKHNNVRHLDSVLMHEMTHAYAASITSFLTSTWKKEGLAEYFAQESSYPVEQGWENLIEGKEEDDQPYKYFKYRVAVTYLLDIKKLQIENVLSCKENFDDVLDEAIKYVNENNKLF